MKKGNLDLAHNRLCQLDGLAGLLRSVGHAPLDSEHVENVAWLIQDLVEDVRKSIPDD